MPKEEWGTKRICPTTGKRFYDLKKSPIVSPYTGEAVKIDVGKTNRTMVADKPDANTKPEAESEEEEEIVLEDDDEDTDVDLGDDVLEDDDDSDEVPLDEIADVAANDDD